jgi:hypothetical protein
MSGGPKMNVNRRAVTAAAAARNEMYVIRRSGGNSLMNRLRRKWSKGDWSWETGRRRTGGWWLAA